MTRTPSTSQVQHAEFQRQLEHCRNPDPYMCVIARQCSRWSATGDHTECPDTVSLHSPRI